MALARTTVLKSLVAGAVLATATSAWCAESTLENRAGTLVDRIVASVEETPVSASEVAFEEAVRSRILASDHKAAFGRLLTEPGEPLEALIFRLILLQQPITAGIEVEDRSLAEKRCRLFEETFESPEQVRAFLSRWGIGRTDLQRYFQTYIRLDTVIELSVDPKVSDEEERSYYERNKDLVFGGKDFTEVADFVSQQLYLLKFEVEYNAWRSRLRSRANKRYIGR
jgi:hypothetical protein